MQNDLSINTGIKRFREFFLKGQDRGIGVQGPKVALKCTICDLRSEII